MSVEALLRDRASRARSSTTTTARLNALRRGRWKLVPYTYVSSAGVRPGTGGYRGPESQGRAAELYDLETDPGEKRGLAGLRPDVVAELQELVAVARAALGDRNLNTKGSEVRGPGRLPAERAHPGGHRARGRIVFVDREPAPRYAGRGSATLTDGRIGTEAFDDGAWLGWRGGSVEARWIWGAFRTCEWPRASCAPSPPGSSFHVRWRSRSRETEENTGRRPLHPTRSHPRKAREVAITFGVQAPASSGSGRAPS